MKKLLIPSIFVISLFGLIYPTEKENTKFTDYCFSLEKIVTKNTFESKPRWQRALVMLAGPVANFILAIGILSTIFVNSVERQFIPEVSSVSSEYLQNNSALRVGDILIVIIMSLMSATAIQKLRKLSTNNPAN